MTRHAAHRAALKTLFREMIDELGGLIAAETCTRVNRSVLAEYGSPNKPDRFPPIDVVLDLEARLGRPLVSGMLVQALGFELVEVAAAASRDALAPIQAVARDSGEMLAAAMAALADGRLDEAERVALLGLLGRLSHDVSASIAALGVSAGGA